MHTLHRASAAADDGSDRACSARQTLCVEISAPSDAAPPQLMLFRSGQPQSLGTFLLNDPLYDSGAYSLWPAVVELAEPHAGVLVGYIAKEQTGYSGGGGAVSRLRLVQFSTGPGPQIPRQVADLPWEGSFLIRACFDAHDEKKRRHACHDEYHYGATVTLRTGVRSGWPQLIYAARATQYPRGASRSRDSAELPPLRRSDLVHAVDPQCTFRRTMSFNESLQQYQPERAFPDCRDYTEL